MTEPFLGQVISVGFQYAPEGWAQCAGQTLPVAQYQALYALLGNLYGGSGTTTLGLPDLRGRVMMGAVPSGTSGGPFINVPPGTAGGNAKVTLNASQLPGHTHPATGVVSLSSVSAAGPVSLGATAQFSDQAVTVTGSMAATKDGAESDKPRAGDTFGDVSGSTSIYATPNSSTAVSLAPITSTGQFSASITGTASGSVSLPVSGSAATTITVGPNTQPPAVVAPVSLLPPVLALLNVIAIQGLYPTRQ